MHRDTSILLLPPALVNQVIESVPSVCVVCEHSHGQTVLKGRELLMLHQLFYTHLAKYVLAPQVDFNLFVRMERPQNEFDQLLLLLI